MRDPADGSGGAGIERRQRVTSHPLRTTTRPPASTEPNDAVTLSEALDEALAKIYRQYLERTPASKMGLA